jgi:hypothetical protein
MGARTSRSTPQAYSSDYFDPNEAPADAAAASRRADQFSPDSAPAEAAASLNALTRNMGVEEPKPTRTPTRALPVSSFEEENNARVARNKAETQEREGLKSLARGIERTDKDLEEARAKPKPALRSALGERQARQMEEKGPIFSRDYGKPKAERDAIEAGERSDRREQARQAAEERGRRESERKREIRRAEVEGNVERDEANQGAARRKQEEEAKRKEAERKRAATSKAMQARQEREEEDTGIAMRKTLLDTERREARQNRPNYPTAERVRAGERRQMAGESARDREDMDTGIAKSRSRSEASSKAMQTRQGREEEDTGKAMRGLRLAEAKQAERQDRPNYPTERRVIDERRRRILGADRPSVFKREDKKRERDTARGSVQGASFKSGGMVSSASKRADGIASKGKTRGRIY